MKKSQAKLVALRLIEDAMYKLTEGYWREEYEYEDIDDEEAAAIIAVLERAYAKSSRDLDKAEAK